MGHNFIRHKLSEYIDGTVNAAEKAEIETHLKACEKCGDALTELKKTIEHVKSIDEIEPPAWMTQKTMAKVRVEADQRKSIYQRLYSVFVVNLPVKAVAVVFLAAIAFYMYRDILPQKLSEAWRRGSAVKNEAAPAAGNGRLMTRNYSQPLKRLPQSPEYKALDMKQEYEKPAPPVPEGARTALQTEARQESSEPERKLKPALAYSKTGSTISITVSVKDIDAATRDTEAAIRQSGGTITKTERLDGKRVYTVTLSAHLLHALYDKLKPLGAVKDGAAILKAREGQITLKIELVKTAPQ